MTTPVAVFDLDGTLVDTAPDLVAALNVVLREAGLAPMDTHSVRSVIGRGAKAMIVDALTAQGQDADEARLEAMHARFLDHYQANIAVDSRPFPGVAMALERLADAGVLLAVCTNKYEALSRQLLTALGLADRFAAIVGPDTLGVRKPDPAHVIGTIQLAAGDRERAVMVGDSRPDMAAANGAGIPAIAVDFGYAESPVSELGADAVISHFDALWPTVAPHLGIKSDSRVPLA